MRPRLLRCRHRHPPAATPGAGGQSRAQFQMRVVTRGQSWRTGACWPSSTMPRVIVSELLTNAHQALTDDASMISLRLLASQYQLLIMVWDGNPQLPVKKLAAPDDLDGRGLMIVEALSDACGAAPGLDGGKIVWARLLVSGQCS